MIQLDAPASHLLRIDNPKMIDVPAPRFLVLTLISHMVLGAFAVVSEARNVLLPSRPGEGGRFALEARRFLVQLSPALLLRSSASFDCEPRHFEIN